MSFLSFLRGLLFLALILAALIGTPIIYLLMTR